MKAEVFERSPKQGVIYRAPTGVVLVAGAILFLSFLTLTLLYPLGELYSNVIPDGIETKPAWSLIERGIITLDKPLYVAAMLALHAVYLGALIVTVRWARRNGGYGEASRNLGRVVLLVGFACAAVLLWSYPLFSQDVFDYIFHTHEWVQYGASPFTHTPSQFSADPLYPYVAWTQDSSPYGPLWIYLTAPLSLLGGSDLFANLVLFKGLSVLCYVGSALLLYLTLGKALPRYQVAGTLLFAWNPLVLMEFGSSGHNDIVMVFFAMLGAWLLVSGRFALGLVALTASILIKIVTVFMLPLFLAYVWRGLSRRSVGVRGVDRAVREPPLQQAGYYFRFQVGMGVPPRLGTMLAYLLLCAGVVALLYAPIWEGFSSMAFLRRGDIIGGAPIGNVATDLLAAIGLGHDLASSLWKIIAWGGFGALILRQAWVVLRGSLHSASDLPGLSWLNGWVERAVGGPLASKLSTEDGAVREDVESDPERLFRASLSVMLFYAVVVSQYYQPWYLSWSLIWAGMLLKPRYGVTVWMLLIFCVVAVAGYVYL